LTFEAHFSFSLHEGWRRNVLDGRGDGSGKVKYMKVNE
jgi:hypothetical protein